MLNQTMKPETINGTEAEIKQEKDVQEVLNDTIVNYKFIEGSEFLSPGASEVIQQVDPENNHLWDDAASQPDLYKGNSSEVITEKGTINFAEFVYKNSIENLKWFVTGIGVLVPLLIFFMNAFLADFFYVSLIFSASAAATILVIYCRYTLQSKTNEILTKNIKRGICCIMLSFVLMFAYFQFLEYSIIPEPQNHENRIQIGFGLQEFSLTAEGQQLYQKYPDKTAAELMLIVDGFNQLDAAKILWKNWTIVLANVSLYLLYTGLFLTWIIGFYFLIKDKKRIAADLFKMKADLSKMNEYPAMS
jgi:hypothetical protein